MVSDWLPFRCGVPQGSLLGLQVDKTTEDKMYLHVGSRLPLSPKKWPIQIDYNNVHMKTTKCN